MIYTSKKSIVDDMKAQLEKPEVALRAMVRVYKSQTKDEQGKRETICKNGVGFTGSDAEILSTFSGLLTHGYKLSEKQIAVAVKRMKKYARQLVDGSLKEGKIFHYNGKYYTNDDKLRVQNAIVFGSDM